MSYLSSSGTFHPFISDLPHLLLISDNFSYHFSNIIIFMMVLFRVSKEVVFYVNVTHGHRRTKMKSEKGMN